jgi:hypothetical protein
MESDNFVYIKQEQISLNCKVFSKRESATPIIPLGGLYLELGVGGGDYASIVMENQKPERMDLIDLFNQGCIRYQRWTNENHLEYVQTKFKDYNAKCIVGDTIDILPTLNDKYRYIYVDDCHSFEHVYKELSLINDLDLLEKNGILGINDYSIYGYFEKKEYGVIEAVNKFLDKHQSWRVVGFALGYMGYSDIYLQKQV